MFTDETITSQEFNQLLLGVKGATPVTLVTETEPPCYKGSPSITKRSEVNGFLQANYEKSVNRQLEREGKEADFKAQGLPWGISLNETCLIVNESKKDGTPRSYVRIQVQNTKDPKYFIDGKEVSPEDVKQYLRPKSKSSRQGTDKQVLPRNYQVTPGACNVKAIAINGRKIAIRDAAPTGTAPLVSE